MKEILRLAEIDPIKAFEKALLRERDKFCEERGSSAFGTTRIVIKKKRTIVREEK